MTALGTLTERLNQATGADAGLDELLAQSFGQPKAGYTGSAESAHALVHAALPDWRLHVGFNATGMFPYARLSRGDVQVDASAPTVPLAILRAAAKTLQPA